LDFLLERPLSHVSMFSANWTVPIQQWLSDFGVCLLEKHWNQNEVDIRCESPAWQAHRMHVL
jgi:hypothetical protein